MLTSEFAAGLQSLRAHERSLSSKAQACQTMMSSFATTVSTAQTDSVVVLTPSASRARETKTKEGLQNLTEENRRLSRALQESKQQAEAAEAAHRERVRHADVARDAQVTSHRAQIAALKKDRADVAKLEAAAAMATKRAAQAAAHRTAMAALNNPAAAAAPTPASAPIVPADPVPASSNTATPRHENPVSESARAILQLSAAEMAALLDDL